MYISSITNSCTFWYLNTLCLARPARDLYTGQLMLYTKTLNSISLHSRCYDQFADHNKCVWCHKWLFKMSSEGTDYGSVGLGDLHEGDRAGFHISDDGVLEFMVNGENQLNFLTYP